MATNYDAWDVQPRESVVDLDPDALFRHLARYALLSPSGHNTQPWRLSMDGDILIVAEESERVLRESTLASGEPHVSLGAFCETLRLAGTGYGVALGIEYYDKVARVVVAGSLAPDPSLLTAIAGRHSNRSEYSDEPVPQSVMAAALEPRLENASVTFVTDRSQIKFVAEQTAVASKQIMADVTFRKELSEWVRNNLTKQFDGMPGFSQGIPTPPSMIAPVMIRRVNIGKKQAKIDSGRVGASGALAIICVQDPSPLAMFDAGRLYSRTCIVAGQHGVATSGVLAAVVAPATRARLVSELKLTGTPVALVRLGFSQDEPRSTPRWPMEAIFPALRRSSPVAEFSRWRLGNVASDPAPS